MKTNCFLFVYFKQTVVLNSLDRNILHKRPTQEVCRFNIDVEIKIV